MSGSLSGKVAVITGGSSGIGLGIAKCFFSEGASVVISGRRQAELDAAVREIGIGSHAVRMDISKLTELDALFAKVNAKYGRIDILVANAAVGGECLLESISEAFFDNIFNINVKGTLFTVQKALPLLSAGASVILLGSIQSIKGNVGFSVYNATKAAIRNFARSWMLELKGKKIRVNVLSPGPVETPALTGLVPPDEQNSFLEGFAAITPLGRVGQPSDIGKVAVFLASEASNYINGVELFVDGGIAQY